MLLKNFPAIFLFFAFLAANSGPTYSKNGQEFSRDRIKIVGSSTVYPFATIVAEEFGRGEFKTPVVEATGTGGGIKLFCSGIGINYPDFANASRKIKSGEIENCARHGIKEIIEIKIGYDAIVLGRSLNGKPFNLTKEQILLALAVEVPGKDGKLIKNPYAKWSDISPSLPSEDIYIYGPPPTSGTRDAFVELVMEEACMELPAFVATYPLKDERKKKCQIIRSDGKFIEAGENDNLIVQKLINNSSALGIFGFSFLQENSGLIQGMKIEGVSATSQNIISGKYKISRPLFLYFKKEHLAIAPASKQFIKELIDPNTIGEEGYLIERGLIPMRKTELQSVRKSILNSL